MGKSKKKQPQLSRPQILALAALGAVCVIGITIGALTEDKDGPAAAPSASASASASSASSSPSAAPASTSPAPAPTPSATQEDTDVVLTAQNNEDLAALLASTDPAELAQEFAQKYQGRAISYDGVIAAINNHDGDDTRFDILVPVGDDPEKATAGPNFQFRDVNLSYDLQLTGDDVPDSLGVGDKLGVTAQVAEYDDQQDLLLLDPVETTVR